jgi:zinc-finger of transposase IS204/IS1001/IS1096/IS1165
MNAYTAAKLCKVLLPPTCPAHPDAVTAEPERLQLQLTTTAPSACCPRCATPSTTVHSRYQRRLKDLPWGTLAVCIQLTVRKFVCRNTTCVRRIFTERLPELVAAYARRTCRLVAVLQAVGMALGGKAGARLAARLRLPTSAPTLLSVVRPALVARTPPTGPVPGTPRSRGRRRRPKPTQPREGAARPPRHARWVAIYAAVHTLRTQGMPLATIAPPLGISRPTVYAYLRREIPPGPTRPPWRPSARGLTPYMPALIRRWCESRADSVQLWREIQALGYPHSARTVCRFLTRLRRAAEAGQAPESQVSPYRRPQGPSARAVSVARVCPIAKRAREAQTYLDQRCQMDAGSARAPRLSRAFLAMVRERRGHTLEAWMAEATASGRAELARFARGLQGARPAIKAGLTLEWSHGVTEGQSPRLTRLKRQGDGRGGFVL